MKKNIEYQTWVKSVLTDIRFGKDEQSRFLPSKVEFVFALTAVHTEIRINLVHNNSWSNYDRLCDIFSSRAWQPSASVWNKDIALYNNKIVERKIITGNILGAYVHPAIAELKPRFISFSLKKKKGGKAQTQIGLLLPMDESKVRKALDTVSIPLHEGFKYATNTNTSYTIAGLGVNFSLMPYNGPMYVVSVNDKHSKEFEKDKRFDGIRTLFFGTPISSIYDKAKEDKELPGKKKRKTLMHYQTGQLPFESEPLQTIIQTLAQMDAVIVVPREQITYGDVKELESRSERDDNEPWDVLDWKNADEVPMPPIRQSLMLRISAPVAMGEQKGKPVFRHSERYCLAQETMALEGLPMPHIQRSTIDALRRCYMKWKEYFRLSASRVSQQQEVQPSLVEQRKVCRDLQRVIGNKASSVELAPNVKALLQDILDSEYLDTNGLYYAKFEDEMMFMSPEKSVAQAFLDALPCSATLDGIRKCIEDYLEDKTDIINSPDKW